MLRDEKRLQKSVGIEKMSATSACRLRSMNRWRALVPLTNLAWRSASGSPARDQAVTISPPFAWPSASSVCVCRPEPYSIVNTGFWKPPLASPTLYVSAFQACRRKDFLYLSQSRNDFFRLRGRTECAVSAGGPSTHTTSLVCDMSVEIGYTPGRPHWLPLEHAAQPVLTQLRCRRC